MFGCCWIIFCILLVLRCAIVAASTPPVRNYDESKAGAAGHWADAGGYVRPKYNTFFKIANASGTDKVREHQYHTLYGKYFMRLGGRHNARKLLEIGLGCDMQYGPGRSSKLWRRFFPQAEIWQAEYNAECVAKYKPVLDALDINAVTGDQADVPTLRRWVEETGGDFDYIIDDGGHGQLQMFHSLIVLFVEALKPGGVYFLEDTNTNRVRSFMDGENRHNMLDIIKDWLELLLNNENDAYPRFEQDPKYAYQPKWPMPLGLKSIECSLNICAFIKCYEDDPQCNLKVMREYKLNDEGVMTASFDDNV